MMKLVLLIVFMGMMIVHCEVLFMNFMMCFLGITFMIFLLKFDVSMVMMIYGDYLCMDKNSYLLIMLSLWILGLMYLSMNGSKSKTKEFMFVIMLLVLLMFFCSSNLMMMYLFFELSLIPTYIMIVYWGSNPERISASFYLLIYMLLISLPLLFYIYYYMIENGSLIFIMNYDKESVKLSGWLDYFVMVGAFLIKLPIYMFHVWLPKAHVEAPVYGSMILAGVLLKLGGYGLYRVMMFMKFHPMNNIVFISISFVGGVLVSFLSMIQVDMKSLVAYSSVVHMNLMLSSFLTMMMLGWSSTLMIMISHGICSSGLFYMVNMYYDRSFSRLLLLNKGMVNYMPSVSIWWFLLCSSNFSFPLSLNFVGEITMLMTLLSWSMISIFIMVFSCFFSSAYSLYLFSYIYHGGSSYSNMMGSGTVKENIVMMYHYFPLFLILLNLLMVYY